MLIEGENDNNYISAEQWETIRTSALLEMRAKTLAEDLNGESFRTIMTSNKSNRKVMAALHRMVENPSTDNVNTVIKVVAKAIDAHNKEHNLTNFIEDKLMELDK